MHDIIHVAVGVIKNSQGQVLLAKRPLDTHQGGLWEFPGGKVEDGENVNDALRRELREEIAIDVVSAEPLIKIQYRYPDKHVLLDVWQVTAFSGHAVGNEGQTVIWVEPDQLTQADTYSLPAANKPIVKAIVLPDQMMITGDFANQQDFRTKLENALVAGIRLVQFRAPQLEERDKVALFVDAKTLCQRRGAKLLFNGSLSTFSSLQTDGYHLSSRELMKCDRRPGTEHVLLGASCHNAEELAQAQILGVDYVTLSPVLPTQSHPDVTPLGWETFAELTAATNVPVYALGGLSERDVKVTKIAGGQGVAAIRAYWH